MNHYIITFTKTHIKITDEQKQTILSSKSDKLDIDGQIIKQSNIAEILDEKKYFESYPDKLPTPVRDDFEENYGLFNQQIRQPTKRAKELMEQGFVDYFVKERGTTLEEAKEKLRAFSL